MHFQVFRDLNISQQLGRLFNVKKPFGRMDFYDAYSRELLATIYKHCIRVVPCEIVEIIQSFSYDEETRNCMTMFDSDNKLEIDQLCLELHYTTRRKYVSFTFKGVKTLCRRCVPLTVQMFAHPREDSHKVSTSIAHAVWYLSKKISKEEQKMLPDVNHLDKIANLIFVAYQKAVERNKHHQMKYLCKQVNQNSTLHTVSHFALRFGRFV